MSEIELKTCSGKVIDIWVPNCVTERSHGSNTRLEQFKNQRVFFLLFFPRSGFHSCSFLHSFLAAAFSIVSFYEKKIAHFSWRCENMFR